ncbi:MAG: APC family permease [Candidatus Micrarchaeaceae archaeon]
MSSDSASEGLKKGALGLWVLVALSMGSIYPLAFAVSNGAGAVVYAGFAAPVVPIFAAVAILVVSIPAIVFSKHVSFAGGYYGFAEKGLGRGVGKFVAMTNLWYYIVMDVVSVVAVSYILSTALSAIYGYTLPIYLFIIIALIATILMFLFTVFNVKFSGRSALIVVGIQILIVVVYSLIVIARTPYNSIQAFNVARAPSGVSGVMLASVTAGFLFFTGYGAPFYFAEESNTPKQTIWKAVILSVVILTVVSVIVTYAEVVAVGLTNASTLATDWNPAVVAFLPYIGTVGVLLFLIIALAGQVWAGIIGGMSGARLIYSMARDKFLFPKRFATLDKKRKTPVTAAFFELSVTAILSIISPLILVSVYGYSNGIFYSLFLFGALTTFLWVIQHLLANIALPFYFHKIRIRLSSLKNISIAILPTIVAGILFVYADIKGYVGIGEPYLLGLIVMFALLITSVIYIIVKHRRGTLYSFVLRDEEQM